MTPKKKNKTWLQKKEDRRSLLQAILFILATMAALFVLVRFGIPALIRIASFVGDLKSSTQLVDNQDQLPPIPPRLDSLPEYSKKDQVKVGGTSEPGSIVKISINGSYYNEVVTNAEGKFIFEDLKLKSGKNVLTATAIDQSGNESLTSDQTTVVFDQEEPSLEILNPQEGERFFEEDNPITVSGLTDGESTVFVNNRRAIVNAEGNFETNIPLSEGKNEIKVKAVDRAGNEVEKTLEVELVI